LFLPTRIFALFPGVPPFPSSQRSPSASSARALSRESWLSSRPSLSATLPFLFGAPWLFFLPHRFVHFPLPLFPSFPCGPGGPSPNSQASFTFIFLLSCLLSSVLLYLRRVLFGVFFLASPVFPFFFPPLRNAGSFQP